MKKKFTQLFALCLAGVLLSGCAAGEPPASNGSEPSSTAVSGTTAPSAQSTSPAVQTTAPVTTVPTAASSSGRSTTAVTATSAATTTTAKTYPRPAGPGGSQSMNSRTYDNAGKFMGDSDGPAYCVYSKKGYNVASIDVLLRDVQVQIDRRSDDRILVAYIFLGMDIADENGQWKNCLDAGLQYGTAHQWHLFYSLFDASEGQQKWYESRKMLDPTHDYRLTLDASKNNGWAELTAYDLTEGRVADSVLLQARYAYKDGHNVSFYQDYALDFPTNVKYTTAGVPSERDWEEITLYNTDQGCYLKNLRIVKATLNGQPWTAADTDRRVMWPDCHNTKIDYPAVKVSLAAFDTELQLDLDMNRS